MARRPYFSGNYGSALGSTANAANLIARAGEVQGQMFANLGKIAVESINKYAENKQKKEEEKQASSFIENYLKDKPEMAAQFGIKGSDLISFEEAVKQGASAIAKNPKGMETVKGLLTMEQERVKAQEASKVRDLQMQQIAQNMAVKKSTEQQARQERMADNQFMQSLMSQTTSPQAQRQADIARPGLPALGNADARNRFMQAQLQQPQNQVPVSNLGSQDFGRFAREQGLDPTRSVQRMEALRQAEQKPQKIARTITVQDGQGSYTQVGVDEAGNPVKDFGPPKPSGMYPTPEEQAKGKEDILSVENANEFVNQTRTNSLESAKSIRPATRALTLLEKGDLDTGGIAELKTNAIAMLDSLGIPINKETMDKVANTQNFRAEVGKFLFENISNTKGSISEKEMDIFAKISPGLQMTPQANKVLLKYVIKKAERDKDRVKFIQDMRRKGVSIVDQRNRLEDYMIEYDLSEVLSPIAGQPSEQTPQNTFNLNGQDVQGEVVGTKPNGDKLIKVNGQIFVQPAQ